ncbi:MAG: hypothetical protein GXX96_16710 [Planctomycetaceae bacterium]|nr:hypothetical protein [Planctomycetaceae bacterium]
MTLLPGSGRFVLLGSIVLLGSVFLLGCGGSDTPAPADAGAGSDTSVDETAAPDDSTADPTPESEAAEGAAEGTAKAPSEESPESPPAEEKSASEPKGEESSKAPKKEAAPPADEKKAPEKKAPAEAAPAAATDQPAEEVVARSEDVAEWKEKDYRAAKEDRDPRLLDAVAYLGENHSGDPDTAKLLAELLAVPEDPEPEPKPEPKVEKKPPKRSMSAEEGMEAGMDGGMDEGMGYEGDVMEEPMDDAPTGEDDMMYDPESAEGGGGRQQASAKAPLAAAYVSLTGGIVRALGANGTKEARAVLERLLAGQVLLGNDRAAVGAVLRTLVDFPSTENDALLRKTLTAPETYRPSTEKLTEMFKQLLGASSEPKEGESPEEKPGEKEQAVETLVAASLANTVTAEDLQDTALPLVERSASMRLRYDLAAYLIGTPSEKIGPRLQELVTATHPLNVQAQIGLYRYAKTPPEMRDAFERYFTSYAGCALGRMLDVSTDVGAALEMPVSTGRGPAAQAGPQGWSGFGDTTTPRPELRGGGASGQDETGMQDDTGMPDEAPADDGYTPDVDPGPAPEGTEGMPSDYMGDEGGGAPGGQARQLKGPGAADKFSIQKFDEVAAGNPNLPYELARQLWGSELGGVMAAKMNALTGLSEGAQLLMLAGHIPTDAMRAQLLKTLQAHWIDGPEALASASVASESGVMDPGFIIILKSLPRREPPARQKGEPTKEQHAQYAWMQTVYSTILGYCERFQKAAENEKIAPAEVLESLPFRVHSTDTITHIYAVDWQKRVGNRLTGAPVDPMRVYYVRFEGDAQYNKVVGAYTRVVPSASERLLRNGLWIEGGKSSPEGTRVSMDVIIERQERKAERADARTERKPTDATEPLVVHVLYVEIKDPNPPKAAEAAEAG